ncbi:MAG: ATP-binding cassette domain-containing protein, partial [Desulfobacterales bacterium]
MKVLTPIRDTRPSPTSNNEPAREKREVDIQMTNKPQPGQKLVSRENRNTVGDITVENPRMTCHAVNVYYGDKQAIKNVSLDIGRNEVISMIGPSGCGKSTFIR